VLEPVRSTTVGATARPPLPAQTERLDECAYRTELDGGTVILSERMASVRSIALGFWFRQGRIHEASDVQGVSHLLEHMVFKGTARRSALEIAAEIERVGGVLDAYTTHEATTFLARVPLEHLDLALDVLCDLAFEPVLRDEDLDLEREVVLEEIAAAEETPEDVAFELHANFLYAGHPYGEPILGTRDSVGSMSRASLISVHRASYRPSNLVIAAAGAVDHADLIARVRDRLPASGPIGPRPEEPAVVGATGYRRVDRPDGRQTHVVAGSLAVPYRDPLRPAVVVACTALGAGMSSRLFQRIREDLGLAYNVHSFHCFFAEAGHVGAYFGARPENAVAAREVLAEELSTFARDGLRPKELEDTRTQLKGQILISLESPSARMNRLAGVALFEQPYRTLDEVAARIDAVTTEECAAAAALFDPARAAMLELSPVEPS